MSAYENRNDRFSFEKLNRILPAETHKDFFIAHFIDNSKEWVRNMSKLKYEQYIELYNTLPTKFKTDMELIKSIGPSEVMNTNGTMPKIYQLAMNEEISIESVIILNEFFAFLDQHEEHYKNSFVLPDYIFKLKKYQPFVLERLKTKLDLYKDIARQVLL